MDERTRIKRGRIVVSMNNMIWCMNNEELFDAWLMCGVADGDLAIDTPPLADVLDPYCEDETFSELLTLFNRLMHKAWLDGGLYYTGISGMDKAEWDEHIKRGE